MSTPTVEITREVRQDTHRCIGLLSEREIDERGLAEGTEATCRVCGRRWVLMALMTSRGWRGRKHGWEWVQPGRTDD